MTTDWWARGLLFENCSCQLVCPAHVSFKQRCENDRCIGHWAVHISKGQFDDVALSDLNVAVVFESPIKMDSGDWIQRLYIDERANGPERDALETVFTGRAGGPWETLGQFVATRLDTRFVPVHFEDAGHEKKMHIPGVFKTTVTAIQGRDGVGHAVLSNLYTGMRDSNRRRARIDEVLDQVGLGKVAHRKVKKLSGGMVRRLGVAQALVHEPQVLVVDEPTVGLDPEERIRFRQLMTQLGRERTILLSTHIVADLGAGCREIALLDSGRTVFQGSPSELIRRALGRVFEVTVAPAEAEAIEGRYEIVSTSVSSDNVTLRGVTAGEQLPASATAVAEPNLEESYLAFMATRGRTSAARQDSGDTAAETAKGGKAT